VQAGWCPGANTQCVLEKAECPPEYSWRSSRQMQGAPNVAHGGICLHSVTVKEMPMGNCADGTCSPNGASCGDLGPHNVINTENCQAKDTLFGRCGDRCAWSPDDCVDYNWVFPSEGCTSDKVETGACEKDGLIFCSVSPDACDEDSTWLSRLEVVSTTDFRCYLGRQGAVILDLESEDSGDVAGIEDRSETSSNSTAITVGVIGGAVGAVMVLIVFLFIKKRQNQQSKTSVNAPFPAVELQKDDVSVL